VKGTMSQKFWPQIFCTSFLSWRCP
jgi:hypothetical protein